MKSPSDKLPPRVRRWVRAAAPLVGAVVAAITLWGTPALAADVGVWAGIPTDDQAIEGFLTQSAIPALRQRTDRARVRLQSLELARRGRVSLSQALPDLDPDRLHDVSGLGVRLRGLDERAELRAAEASTLVPGTRTGAAVANLLAQTHEYEDQADAAERRVLVGARAWLREQPWMGRAALAWVIQPLERRVDAARNLDPDDPANAEVLRAAVDAAAERDRMESTVRALREHRLAGGPLPVYADDLARVAVPAQTSGALLRLGWIREFLAPDSRSELDAILAPFIQAAAKKWSKTAEPTPAKDVQAERAAAQSAVNLAESVRTWTPPALELVVDARLKAAQGRLDRVGAVAVESREVADATTREAAQAREVKDATAERTAALIEMRVPTEERVRALQNESDRIGTGLEILRTRGDKTLERGQAALALAESGAGIPDGIDQVYASVRTLVADSRNLARVVDAQLIDAQSNLRDSAVISTREDKRIAEENAALDEIRDIGVRAARSESLDRWTAARADENTLAREYVALLKAAREQALVRVQETADVRRSLSGWVGTAQRTADYDRLGAEFVEEISQIGPAYFSTQRERIDALRRDPWWFLKLHVLTNLLLGSVWLLVSGLVWFVARRYADSLVGQVMTRVTGSWGLRNTELDPLRSPVRRALVTFVDVVATWALFTIVPKEVPELSVVLLLIFEVQLLRLELAAYELIVAQRPTFRPAMFRLTPKAWRLGWRSVLALGLWLSAYRVLHAFSRDVLAGFATEVLIGWLAFVIIVVLVVGLLYLWAPIVRARVSMHGRVSWITQLLGGEPPTVLLGAPQALGGLVFVSVVGLRALAFRVARQGIVARWFAAFDRYRLGRSDDSTAEVVVALPTEVRTALLHGASSRAYEDRPVSRLALSKALNGWRHERRQGMIALLGDSGEGRGVLLRAWEEGGGAAGMLVRWVEINDRLVTERDAFVWLARAFELNTVPDDVDGAIEALNDALDECVLIVTGMHLSFLRTVGGFGAVRTLLEIFHADGRKRFWILAFYRPAWRYLERLGSSLNTQLVRAKIDISPMDGDALQRVTTKLAEHAGYELDFHQLVSTGALAGDAEVEYRRAVESYYRLLETASAGNPAVALELWLTCLVVLPTDEGKAAVQVAVDGAVQRAVEVPVEAVVEGPVEAAPLARLQVSVSRDIRVAPRTDLGDDQLFVLAAIRTQGEVDESNLSEILNMNIAQVKAVVRQLLSRDLLDRSERGLFIARRCLPSITLTLRRRHFLHTGGS